MLSDQIQGDKERIGKLMKERQTMLTTIAHGIKTPVSNITLYASSIETGLYQPDRKPNQSDAAIAAKIEKNAGDINTLVEEMINTSSTGMVDFEPKIQAFYINEVEEYIREEYSNRLEVQRIPLEIDCCHNAMINSDKSGILRILTQLMENAIKYGDGTGIKVSIDKQEEGYYFSVKNRGKTLPENEIPYIFGSFWRGSNAQGVKGSGIGLFEARTIASRLGGDIYVKQDDVEIEFIVFIEK
jgi:signal transduction histidine kinase